MYELCTIRREKTKDYTRKAKDPCDVHIHPHTTIPMTTSHPPRRYTGAGGQDESKKQVRDQDFNGDNEGLRLAQAKGTPVRVVRGTGEKGGGLVYEGLFRVVDHKKEVSKDG